KVGTSWSILFPSLGIKLAASTGKTAFFAPSTLTLPFSLFPPFTTILSICQFSFNICSVYLYSSRIRFVPFSTTILLIFHFFVDFFFIFFIYFFFIFIDFSYYFFYISYF